jgi:hypothetical protein
MADSARTKVLVRAETGAALLFALLAPLAAVGCGGPGEGGEAATPRTVLESESTTAQETASTAPRPGPAGLVRQTRVRVGGVPVTVEIADTPALRERGLMYRDSLPPDYGMLFVYPDEGVRGFWMRNTVIPLDIAFMDRNGVILNVEQMAPRDENETYSAGPAQYALEMPEGWFAEHGVGVGDRLEF